MHTLLRQIHLGCTLILLAFVLMYFATGFLMTHAAWFGAQTPVETRRREALDAAIAPGRPDDPAYAAWLQDRLGLTGQRQPARRRGDGQWEYRFFRPGLNVLAIVAADLGTVEITEQRQRWVRTAGGYHRLHGYGGGGLYDVWAFLYDLASASMIVFAITGIWLWHQHARVRWPGWILLAAGFLFTLANVLYLWLSP